MKKVSHEEIAEKAALHSWNHADTHRVKALLDQGIDTPQKFSGLILSALAGSNSLWIPGKRDRILWIDSHSSIVGSCNYAQPDNSTAFICRDPLRQLKSWQRHERRASKLPVPIIVGPVPTRMPNSFEFLYHSVFFSVRECLDPKQAGRMPSGPRKP